VGAVSPGEIERALREVAGVEAVRVCAPDGTITEVHIAAAPGTRAKHIARDVRSFLAAKLGVEVDHKKISIALRKSEVAEAGEGHAAAAVAAANREARTRLESLTLHVETAAAEARVRLSAAGRELRGCARGSPSADGLERAVLSATLEALQQLVRHEVRLAAGELRRLRLGSREARLVEVTVCRANEEQHLLGIAWVRQDAYRAVVMATLSALNRTLCRLAPVHWTEIRVEPEGPPDDAKEVS